MSQDFEDLPEEIQRGVMAFTREVDGELEVDDMMGLINFIFDHSTKYPALLRLVKVNEEALTRHINETGEVPPGVKAIRKTPVPGTNVTKLDIVHGPATLPKDEE
jgi:hypothetical protein